jgi:cell division septum initiation protein DivIVA
MSFSKTKNGYSEKEVDDYISLADLNYKKALAEKDEIIKNMQNEIAAVKKQEKTIAVALTAAVDKAKEIETSSKNIYRLK